MTKSGYTKGQVTCHYVKKGQQCPLSNKGCPFNHKKPNANAAPAQPGAAGQERGRPGQPGGPGRSRSQTPHKGGKPHDNNRTRSQSDRSREKNSKLICFAYSRGSQNCKGPKDGCYKQHVADKDMTHKQRLARDKVEEAKLKAGKSLGYSRSVQQANAAAANVGSSGRSPSAGSGGKPRSPSPSSQKGKGKGKGKGKDGKKGKPQVNPNKPCPAFKETGKCTRGATCWYRAATPGHP